MRLKINTIAEQTTIGICAPSGRVDEAALKRGVSYLEDLGHRVIVAMMRSGDIYSDATALLDWAFSSYSWDPEQ